VCQKREFPYKVWSWSGGTGGIRHGLRGGKGDIQESRGFSVGEDDPERDEGANQREDLPDFLGLLHGSVSHGLGRQDSAMERERKKGEKDVLVGDGGVDER